MTGQLPTGAYKIIRPRQLPFISYPYEWAFSQLQEAALLTLEIQKQALSHGLTLRDASAYNIQLVDGKLCLIDTLSFDGYQPGRPWLAYRQFCQHFLGPLALASFRDPALLQLLRVHIDGIPLELAAKLLPWRARWQTGIATHIVLQARFQRRYATRTAKSQAWLSRTGLNGLLDSLERTVRSLSPSTTATAWSDYYSDNNYSQAALVAKEAAVRELATKAKPRRIVDLGSNNGFFSRSLAATGVLVISADSDPTAVEANYRQMRTEGTTNLIPIKVDLTNPSPALGWNNRERSSFNARVRADMVVALALVHHLAIANNLPLGMIADYFASLGPSLIIEFVPKTDSQVRRLLASREDIFNDYTVAGFEAAFRTRYKIVQRQALKDSTRVIYLMERLHETQ